MTARSPIGRAVAAPVLLSWAPTMPNLLRHAVERFGDRELLVSADGNRLTYREADERSRLWARRLLGAGIGKGSRVGLLLPQDGSWLIGFFALARVGALSVALSTFARPPEVRKLLGHSDVQALLASGTINGGDSREFLEDAIPELADADDPTLWIPLLPHLRAIWIDQPSAQRWARPPLGDAGPLAPEHLLAEVESEVHASDPLAVIYTSGTTAEPKGVVHTNGALVRHGEALRRLGAMADGDRVLAAMPFFWVGGLSRTLGPALHAGATLLTQTRFDAEGAPDLIETEKATDIAAWETVLRRIVDHPRFAEGAAASLQHDPRVRRGGLGMTETCAQHTWRRPGEDPASVGSPVPGVEHRVTEPGTERAVSPGVRGEICVRGYSVCAGMIGRERHEVFDSDGWYHTGDGGWFDERGLLHFDARLTDMIKTDGNNVAPAEIEATLLAHPSITFAAAFGIPHPTKGEEPAAVVVARDDPPDRVGLESWLRTHLASYKVPRRILLLPTEGDVPLLASGKPDKVRLAAMLGESAT